MAAMDLRVVLVVLVAVLVPAAPRAAPRAKAAPLSLQIVHLNDFHARFEPVSAASAGNCKQGDACIGGLARVARAVADEKARNPDALVLNAGDNFQGTLWYSLFRWNGTGHFMSELPWDAMTIGNHEFDHGIAGLVPFLKIMIDSGCPIVIANMDDSKEPSMHGLHQPSLVLERAGWKIGIVGYILQSTPTIANTENLSFGDELEALEKEAARLKTEEDVDIIVALSHAGLDVDLEVAKSTQYADVIVGGHTHSLLYTGTPPNGDAAAGPYPEVVRQSGGRTVLVVQSAAYTKYLGNLTVHFDEKGEVASWSGNSVYMDSDLPQDEAMVEEMVPWGAEVDAQGLRVIGSSRVELDKQEFSCYSDECSLGNFVADVFVDYYVGRGGPGSWTAASIAFTNAGGQRNNIAQGDITYGDLVTSQPFENTVDLIELQGSALLQALEDSVSTLSLLQWSGLRVVFDYALPAGQRVVSAEVLCADCLVPRYAPVEPEKWYALAAPSFVVEGGDDFKSITNNLRNRKIGPIDLDIFQDYLSRSSPLLTGREGRITILNAEEHDELVARRQASHPPTIFAWRN